VTARKLKRERRLEQRGYVASSAFRSPPESEQTRRSRRFGFGWPIVGQVRKLQPRGLNPMFLRANTLGQHPHRRWWIHSHCRLWSSPHSISSAVPLVDVTNFFHGSAPKGLILDTLGSLVPRVPTSAMFTPLGSLLAGWAGCTDSPGRNPKQNEVFAGFRRTSPIILRKPRRFLVPRVPKTGVLPLELFLLPP